MQHWGCLQNLLFIFLTLGLSGHFLCNIGFVLNFFSIFLQHWICIDGFVHLLSNYQAFLQSKDICICICVDICLCICIFNNYQAFLQSKEISVGPLGGRPGGQVLDVRRQVHLGFKMYPNLSFKLNLKLNCIKCLYWKFFLKGSNWLWIILMAGSIFTLVWKFNHFK